MDGNGMGRRQRAALRRVIALLLALADLAERAAGRSRPVRWLVLSILGVAEAITQDYVVDLTGIPASDLSMPSDDDSTANDSVARVIWLASAFRLLSAILAAALAALPDDQVLVAAARTNIFVARLRDLMTALPVECRDTS